MLQKGNSFYFFLKTMIYVQFSNHLITFFDGGLEKIILVIVTDLKNQLLFMGLGFRV